MRKIILSLAALLGAVAVFSFYNYYSSRADRSVAGKVLIVLNNSEVRKLALVDIQVLSAVEAKRWFDYASPIGYKAIKEGEAAYQLIDRELGVELNKSESFITTSLKLKSLGEAALRVRKLQAGGSLMRNDTTASAAKRGTDEVSDGYGKLAYLFQDDIKAMVKDQRFKEIAVSTAEALNKLESEATSVGWQSERIAGSLSRDAAAALRDIQRVKAAIYMPTSGYSRAAEAISDGDGQFTLKLPPGNYVVFASSRRQLPGNQVELFYWAVKLTVTSDSGNSVILGNQNLESNSPECLWPESFATRLESSISNLKSVSSSSDTTVRLIKSNSRSIGANRQSIIVGLAPYK